MKLNSLFLIILFNIIFLPLAGQEKIIEELTFAEVVQLAREQSPDAIMAKHRFRANYWQYRTFKAEFKPNLTLSTTLPEFSRAIKKYQNSDGTYTYVEDNMNSSSIVVDPRTKLATVRIQIKAAPQPNEVDLLLNNLTRTLRLYGVSLLEKRRNRRPF